MNNFVKSVGFNSEIKTISVVDFLWGDNGKGKIVAMLAPQADIIARGTGGDNAGHTIYKDGKKFIFCSLPSGCLEKNKINVIGSGTVLNPSVFLNEMKYLTENTLEHGDLMVSCLAKMILPTHLLIDRLEESNRSEKIGTTGRGVGPAYLDHYDRIGLVISDLQNTDIFVKKFKVNLEKKIKIIKNYDLDLIKNILSHEDLNESYFHPVDIINKDAVIETYLSYGRKMKKFIQDSDKFMRSVVGNRNILLEGAQGILLSIDHGTYPYVTSSDPSIFGLTKGVGLSISDVDLQLGIIKGAYFTRVGEGPFVTEAGGKISSNWCRAKTKRDENKIHASINDPDDFKRGVAIRRKGGEYGSRTKRPRRVGWIDIPILKYAMEIAGKSGNNMVLTKMDIFSGCKKIKICHHYLYQGPDYFFGSEVIKRGQKVFFANPDPHFLKYCEPVFMEIDGWDEDISMSRSFDDLPDNLKKMIKYYSLDIGMDIKIISVGPESHQTIFL